MALRCGAVMKLRPAARESDGSVGIWSIGRELVRFGDGDFKSRTINHCPHAAKLPLVPVAERPQAEVEASGRGDVDAGHGPEV